MSSKFKHYRGHSEDEDSHNYIDDESEAMTFEEESEPYDYNYKDAVIDFLYSKRVIFSFLSICFACAAIIFWDIEFQVVAVSNEKKTVLAGTLLLVASATIAATVFLEYVLEKLSMRQLKKGRSNAAFWFYLNELSLYVAFGLMIIALHTYIGLYLFNFYIETPYSLKFYLYDALWISLLTTTVLGLERMVVKSISMSFNYNLYINRIKKCILFDFFVNLINHLHEIDGETSEALPSGGDEEAVLAGGAESLHSLNMFIFEKKFRARDAESLSLDAKRILLKEFQEMLKTTVTYSGTLPMILGKIRSIALSKANNLVRKLIRTAKIEKIGDLSKYFANQEIFEYVLDQLDLSREEKVERSNIVRIIEKAYRERYIIYKSIEQINAAIDKVALVGQIAVFVAACIAMYTASIEDKMSTAASIVSTIFGAQFINRIISENMTKSLVLLFIIHPFDIGDRVLIMLNGTEENLIVAELNVFSTQFYRWDGTSIFIPNHILADLPISNIRRSGPMMETHSIQINSSTDPSKLYVLKQMILGFVRENSEIYTDYVLVNYEKIENSNKLFIKVLIQYQSNMQNYESYLKKRSYFIIELNRALKSLEITYTLPVQKIALNAAATEAVDKTVRIKKDQ